MWRVLEQKPPRTRWFEVEVQLVENVPGAMKKVLGDRFGYIEEGTLDRKRNRYRFRATPSSMADKTQIGGEMYSEPVGDNRVKRIVDFSIEVKMMMIGKIIEQRSIDDTKASYDKMASFLRSYLKEKAVSSP